MSWFDAHEYLMLQTAVRDRIDDLMTTRDTVVASADGVDDTARATCEPGCARREPDAFDTRRFCPRRPALGASGAAR
jgi:hypothetical protein